MKLSEINESHKETLVDIEIDCVREEILFDLDYYINNLIIPKKYTVPLLKLLINTSYTIKITNLKIYSDNYAVIDKLIDQFDICPNTISRGRLYEGQIKIPKNVPISYITNQNTTSDITEILKKGLIKTLTILDTTLLEYDKKVTIRSLNTLHIEDINQLDYEKIIPLMQVAKTIEVTPGTILHGIANDKYPGKLLN